MTELIPPPKPKVFPALEKRQWKSRASGDKNPFVHFLASRRTESSARTYQDCLDRIAGLVTGGRVNGFNFAWHLLRYKHTNIIRAGLQAIGLAPSTVNKHLAALRGVLKQAYLLDLMSANDYYRARDIEDIQHDGSPRGRRLAQAEIKALFHQATVADTNRNRRDAATLAVLYLAGLRRSELTGLDFGDYYPDEHRLHVRSGKGKKAGDAWIMGGGDRYLSAWIAVRGSEPGPLITWVRNGDHIQHNRLWPRSVAYICKRLAVAADLDHFSPHDLRYTFISDLLDNGADLAMVQRLARHKHASTTSSYDRRGDKEARKTAALIHVPILGFARHKQPKGET